MVAHHVCSSTCPMIGAWLANHKVPLLLALLVFFIYPSSSLWSENTVSSLKQRTHSYSEQEQSVLYRSFSTYHAASHCRADRTVATWQLKMPQVLQCSVLLSSASKAILYYTAGSYRSACLVETEGVFLS